VTSRRKSRIVATIQQERELEPFGDGLKNRTRGAHQDSMFRLQECERFAGEWGTKRDDEMELERFVEI
jgi:hypothetical protein